MLSIFLNNYNVSVYSNGRIKYILHKMCTGSINPWDSYEAKGEAN